jgi:hypothetical protein
VSGDLIEKEGGAQGKGGCVGMVCAICRMVQEFESGDVELVRERMSTTRRVYGGGRMSDIAKGRTYIIGWQRWVYAGTVFVWAKD